MSPIMTGRDLVHARYQQHTCSIDVEGAKIPSCDSSQIPIIVAPEGDMKLVSDTNIDDHP